MPKEAKKRGVLVAGATGYLGQFVTREFKRRGYYVRALARSSKKLEHMKGDLDEIVEGAVTDPDSIEGVCDNIEMVFSCVGKTRQKDKLTYMDVDYHGNANLLDVAQKAGVRKFVYVSVYHVPEAEKLAIVRAHEDFVALLASSGMDYSVVRPTGYFSDMSEFFDMARAGRVYLIGKGRNRMNPIHGADLAIACVDAMEGQQREVPVGGPEVLTYRSIAETAFRVLDKPCRITCVPVWILRVLAFLVGIFNRQQGDLLSFFVIATAVDGVAPKFGTHTLEQHYKEMKSR